MFITKRKLNMKLDLLLQRQNIMMRIIATAELNDSGCRRLAKKWNKLWDDIVEDKNGDRD